jgi:NRAMP (natural resistance-associated macrophage protein)-like metal ion transporter
MVDKKSSYSLKVREYKEDKTHLGDLLGPGFISGAADDDPSGIATYTQAGSSLGYSMLWTVWLTLPLMISVQEMCGRIGLVTKKGLITHIKEANPLLARMIGTLAVSAIIFNITANFAAIGAVVQMLFPFIQPWITAIFVTLFIAIMIGFTSYKTIENWLKWFALVLFVYFVVPFIASTDWGGVVGGLVPTFNNTPLFTETLLAVFGTTIAPYLFFWETNHEIEDDREQTKSRKARHLKSRNMVMRILTMRESTVFGMLFSNIIMLAIIIAAAAATYKLGIPLGSISTVEDAARALEPIAGSYSKIIFAIGIISSGLLAIPVLSGTCGYIISESYGWKEGLDKKVNEAQGFYIAIIGSMVLGMLFNFLGIPPITALFYSAILYGLITPPLLLAVISVANNTKAMGKYRNGLLANIGGAITVLASIAVVVYYVVTHNFG